MTLGRRSFLGAGDVQRMQRLASRLWPLGFHPGGLGWCLATDQLGRDIALFVDDDELLGFAGVDEPGVLLAQADPKRPEVAKAIVDWFLEYDGSAVLRVGVVDADAALRAAVEAAGFIRVDVARPVFRMHRDTTPSTPAPPTCYSVRAVEPDEFEARVAVHRASWNPHALPWHPAHRPDYPPEARSGHSESMYARVRDTWLYDPALDLVAVADDGAFVGCCIVWLDPDTGVAEIEPLGVVPDHRRRGVAGALCNEATRRVALAGGSAVYINQGPNAAYPAPAGAYAKAGFDVLECGRVYELRR